MWGYMLYYLCVKKGENINISVCVLIFRKENPGRINQDLTKMAAYGEGRNKLRGQKWEWDFSLVIEFPFYNLVILLYIKILIKLKNPPNWQYCKMNEPNYQIGDITM